MQDDEQGVDDVPEGWHTYWADFAEAFIHPLTANGLLNKFVTNPAVTGTYGEAWIQFTAQTMLSRYRVSTGAIIRAGDRIRQNLQTIPQCDLIIWDPSELPALFEQGRFALVPNFSARAIIEVKRTCRKIATLQEQLKRQQEYMLPRYRQNVLGIVISHGKTLFDGEVDPSWLNDKRRRAQPPITRLLDKKHQPDANGTWAFIYFLSQVASNKE